MEKPEPVVARPGAGVKSADVLRAEEVAHAADANAALSEADLNANMVKYREEIVGHANGVLKPIGPVQE